MELVVVSSTIGVEGGGRVVGACGDGERNVETLLADISFCDCEASALGAGVYPGGRGVAGDKEIGSGFGVTLACG